MNKFALFTFLLMLFAGAKAQDRIISINNDTIYCRIAAINNERIMYELKNKDGSVTGKSIILSQVLEYSRSPQSVANTKSQKSTLAKTINQPEQQWCLGLNIGKSNLPWFFSNVDSSDEMPDYFKKLSSGVHITTSAHYMFNSYIGLGAEYSFFNKSFTTSIPSEYSPSMFLLVSEKYREYINYLGPSVVFLQQLDAKHKFSLTESVSAGILTFRMENQSTSPNVDYSGYTDITHNSLITGNCLSAKLGLAATYRLTDKLSVGLGSNFVWASLKKVSMESRGPNNESSSDLNQELPNALNISRFDYSIVVRYHL